MLLNLINNGKIIQNGTKIKLNDFTILTGENGSGKTQMLELIRDYASGYAHDPESRDENGNIIMPIAPISDNQGNNLVEIIYTHPGLRGSFEYINHSVSLIATIKEEWNQLEPIVCVYNTIRHKTFTDDFSELQEVNRALANFVQRASQNINNHNIPIAKVIEAYQLQQLKKISDSSRKAIWDLNLLDFIIFYQVPLNIFSAAIDLLFHQFFLKNKYYPLLTVNVTPPWNVFNEILERARFKYKAEYTVSTEEENPSFVKLVDRKNGKEIGFQSLSSGEMTIMNLIFALYNSSSNGHFPQVILFDEPDAHLHPSLTQIFLDVVQDVLLKDHQVKIILTTHSPSTVALAPEESIYCMDRDLGRPIKINKRAAIDTLSFGLASVSIEESSLGISYNIKQANKDILFTEGITDKIILEIAWEKLYPNVKRNFYIQDCFSASFLGNLFNQGDGADGIFHQFSDLKMIALFDFDDAGYSNWNRENKFPQILENDPKKCLTRYNGENGYLLLLPVPNITEISQQVIISGNETYKNQSYLTIESLLYNNDRLKKYFVKQPLPGGGMANVISGNKSKKNLSLELTCLDAESFIEFKPLFEKIQDIIN